MIHKIFKAKSCFMIKNTILQLRISGNFSRIKDYYVFLIFYFILSDIHVGEYVGIYT